MTREEAIRIVAQLSSAWPNTNLPDATVETWIEHLLPRRAEVAAEVAKALVTTSKFFPSIAEFTEGYRAELEYERVTRAQDRGLPSPVPVVRPEAHEAGLKACREALAQADAEVKKRNLERAGKVDRIVTEAGGKRT